MKKQTQFSAWYFEGDNDGVKLAPSPNLSTRYFRFKILAYAHSRLR